MGREENVLIFQDTERLSKTNGKLNADLKASASGQKLILETDALEKPNLNIYDEPAKVIVSKKRILDVAVSEGNDTVILGAFGCGAFMNKANIVAYAAKNVIKEYMHAFKNIEFAIYCSPQDDTNYKTFRLIERDR